MKNKITIEDEGEYIHISGCFTVKTISGKDLKKLKIAGYAKDDAKKGDLVHICF